MKHKKHGFLIGFPARSLKVDLLRLRCALDHSKILYRTHVSDEVFDRLSRLKGQHMSLPLSVENEGRFNPLKVGSPLGPRMILKSREMRICIWRAGSAPEDAKRKNGVEVDLHGHAFNGSKTGLDVIEILRTALEELLFPERGTSAEQRRRRLSPLTFPGRTDVAVDIEATGEKAHIYAEKEVFFVDDEEGREEHWCFRGNQPSLICDRTHGDGKGGRTLDRKTKRHQLVIYEKAKVRDARRKASEELKEIWRKRGWTGSPNVLRCELRVMAEWLSVNAPKVTFDKFLQRLPELFRMVAERDRHLAYEPGSTRTKSRRPLSPLWQQLVKALGKLGPTKKKTQL